MAASFDPVWGPYRDEREARALLSRFVDRACGPDLGIAWVANGSLHPLRPPASPAGTFQDVAVFEWSPTLPDATPPTGFLDRIERGIRWCLEQEGRAAISQAQSGQAMAQAASGMISRLSRNHPDDALGVALDVVAVGLSVALLPTGLGLLGGAALIAGSLLLLVDGTSYALELGGDEEDAEVVKRRTEIYRIVFTLAALPDAAWNGVKVLQEMQEARMMRTLDLATSSAASSIAGRTANANRAVALQEIAERANLRAQLNAERITAALKFDLSPKGAGLGSTVLLVREEYLENDSSVHRLGR